MAFTTAPRRLVATIMRPSARKEAVRPPWMVRAAAMRARPSARGARTSAAVRSMLSDLMGWMAPRGGVRVAARVAVAQRACGLPGRCFTLRGDLRARHDPGVPRWVLRTHQRLGGVEERPALGGPEGRQGWSRRQAGGPFQRGAWDGGGLGAPGDRRPRGGMLDGGLDGGSAGGLAVYRGVGFVHPTFLGSGVRSKQELGGWVSLSVCKGWEADNACGGNLTPKQPYVLIGC